MSALLPEAPLEKNARRLELFVLASVALACLGFQLWMPSTQVAEEDYRRMSAHLATLKQPGDVMLLAPWWTERARLFVDESVAVIGHLHSDELPLETAARIWVLSEPRLPGSRLSSFWNAFLPQRKALSTPVTFGNLELQLFQNDRFRPVAFESEVALSMATVFLEAADGSQQLCSKSTTGHRCANGSEVLTEWHEVVFAPERCLRLYPPGGQTKAVVEFQNAQAISELVLRAAYTWDRGTFREGVTASTVAIEVNGQTQHLVLEPGLEGFRTASLRDIQPGQTIRLTSAAANGANREICVQLKGYSR